MLQSNQREDAQRKLVFFHILFTNNQHNSALLKLCQHVLSCSVYHIDTWL